jgi:hypothetical protein
LISTCTIASASICTSGSDAGDAIHLVHDKIGQRGLLGIDLARQQLRRPLYARQRVLDFVAKDRRGRHRLLLAAVGLLANLVTVGLSRHKNVQPAIGIAQRRCDIQIDIIGLRAVRLEPHILRADIAFARRDRTVQSVAGKTQQRLGGLADDAAAAPPEKGFGGFIGIENQIVGTRQQQRQGYGRQQQPVGRAICLDYRRLRRHFASAGVRRSGQVRPAPDRHRRSG